MSDDAYNWEMKNAQKLNVEVVAAVYVYSNQETLCGFFEDENKTLSLPTKLVTKDKFASEIAVQLFKKLINVDVMELDITPYCFIDQIYPPISDEEKASRTVLLCYSTFISPGTPIHKELRFLSNDEIDISLARIARGHYKAYREGIL